MGWGSFSRGVHETLNSWADSKKKDCQPLEKHQFHAVVTVLGTNDIPKVTAGQKRWDKLEDAVNTVAKTLKDYLVEASMGSKGNSEHPSTSGLPVYISEHFYLRTRLRCRSLQ